MHQISCLKINVLKIAILINVFFLINILNNYFFNLLKILNKVGDISDNICKNCDASCLTCTGPQVTDFASCVSLSFLTTIHTCE